MAVSSLPENAAFLLDLTRTVSRGLAPTITGIDRVERAYLSHVLARAEPVFGLVRSKLGYLLLDRAGLGAFQDLLSDPAQVGAPDLLSRVSYRRNPGRQVLESEVRRLSLDRCRQGKLSNMISRHCPQGVHFVNVGHANLTEQVFSELARGTQPSHSTVMIHDMIPLEHPKYSRKDTPDAFRRRFRAAAAHSDRIVVPSEASAAAVRRNLGDPAPGPEILVAPLGIEIGASDDAVVDRLDLGKQPFFLFLGTLEPRKNIPLLLKIWEDLESDATGAEVPRLVLAGSRGWMEDRFFDELEEHPLYGRVILELGGLSDAEISGLLEGATALVSPSRVEGYGLPVLEAAVRGTPVLCSDIAVYHETLGDFAVYLDPADLYAWKEKIREISADPSQNRTPKSLPVPTWDAHFQAVFPAGKEPEVRSPAIRGKNH